MHYFLEYEFRDLCLRFLLDDNDLLTLIAIISHQPFFFSEFAAAPQADLRRHPSVQFPVDSPALNTWLYLISRDNSTSACSKFEFPSLPRVRSLLCQQLRKHSANSGNGAGGLNADGTDVERGVVEIRLRDRPYLVAWTARQLADCPQGDAIAFYASVMLSLPQVAEDCGKMPEHRGRVEVVTAAEWLMDLQNTEHLFGLDAATTNVIHRATELVFNRAAAGNERAAQAVHFAETTIQDRRQQGAELLRSRDFLPRLLDRLVRLDELESQFASSLQQAKIASLKQLAYGASHEINNPLGNIATRSQTLLRGETDPERRRQLAMIVSQAYRAHDMISDMMLFAHPPTLQPETVSLYDMACRAVGDLQAIADQQRTNILLAGETDFTDLYADADHLVMLIKALCQNALEACQAGGQVRVTIEKCASGGKCFFRIDVADDGPGLSEAARRHLFDPFYSGREAGRGLGLGLSKAWTIVQLHAGKIEVSAGADGGTKFSVFLPASAVSLQAS